MIKNLKHEINFQHKMQKQANISPQNNAKLHCSQQILFTIASSGWKLKRDSYFAFQIMDDNEIGVKLLDKSLIKDVQVSFYHVVLLMFFLYKLSVSKLKYFSSLSHRQLKAL